MRRAGATKSEMKKVTTTGRMWPWRTAEAVDGARAYFDTYQREWTTIHETATRKLPVMRDDEDRLVGALRNLVAAGDAVLDEHVRAVEDFAALDAALMISGLWDADPSQTKHNCSMPIETLAAERKFTCTMKNVVAELKKLEVNERSLRKQAGQRPWAELKATSESLLQKIAHRVKSPVDAVFPEWNAFDDRSCQAAIRPVQRENSNYATDSSFSERMSLENRLQLVEMPRIGWLDVEVAISSKSESDRVLALQTLRGTIDCVLDQDLSMTSKILSELLINGKDAFGPTYGHAWSTKTIRPCGYTLSISDRSDLSFRQFDGMFRRRRPINLEIDSSIVFKKIFRRNAADILVRPLPEILEDEIESTLRSAASALDVFCTLESTSWSCRGALRQLTLPIRVIKDDDLRLGFARNFIVQAAHDIYQAIRPLQASVASLSIEAPSMWKNITIRSIVKQCFREKWAPSVETSTTSKLRLLHSSRHGTSNSNAQSSEDRVHMTSLVSIDSGSEPRGPGSSVLERNQTGVIHDGCNQTGQICIVIRNNECEMSTEDIVNNFLRQDPVLTSQTTNVIQDDRIECSSSQQFEISKAIDYLARPAIWTLVRRKLLRVEKSTMQGALQSIPLQVIGTVIAQLYSKLKLISKNPGGMAHEDIVDMCVSFRQAVWLQILIMISTIAPTHPNERRSKVSLVTRILASHAYRSAIGPSQFNALLSLHVELGGSTSAIATGEWSEQAKEDEYSCDRPPKKKAKFERLDMTTPVSLICSSRFLLHDELVDELGSSCSVSVLERDIAAPVDLILDERNCVCLFSERTFEVEHAMKSTTYKLAKEQVQYQKVWIVIEFNDAAQHEDNLHAFFAALANFSVETQTFMTSSADETSRCIRGIVNACADSALANHRILPRLWFARPFLLEEESQIERFLASTQIVNYFTAQSLLHRITLDDLMQKRLEELQALILDSTSTEQLKLLWGLMQRRFGFGDVAQ